MPFFSRTKQPKKAATPTGLPGDKSRYEGTLIAHGLTKTYNSRRVVNGASLVVRRGEAVGLLG
ncbi:MAG: LPS export ABC transporter ATP-binding protein, partial [Allorhizobium sp.]